MTKQSLLLLTALTTCFAACNNQKSPSTPSPIVGSWQLISGTLIKGKDTTFTDYTKDVSMIKILNDTHFSFLNHDKNHGKDSANASFIAGGGTYKLEADKYTEQLEYCSAREWEGNTFEFTLKIEGDTLTQTGVEKIENLGVEQLNIEKYVRIK